MRVPLLDLREQYQSMKKDTLAVLEEICDSQHFILGDWVEKFEKEVAEYCECSHAVGVTSGSDALIIALMVEGIGAGDEVITTPFTFFATVGAIARVGATPVFVDIDPGTFNIDADAIEAKITSKTKAIIPVHLFGQCANMGKIMEIAENHKLLVVEDAAQAIGAEYEGKRAGSLGNYGCFSFFPSKNLGGFGDGGMVTTNNAERADLLKIYRNHGANPKYYHKYIGGNFRLDALQAAILSLKLKQLDDWSTSRQKNAAEYRTLVSESSVADKVELPVKADYRVRHIYNQFSILVKDGERDALQEGLKGEGVDTAIYYPVPLHLQECFSYLGHKEGDFPASERVAKEILSLPIYPESTSEMRRHVVASMEKVLG